MQQGASGRVSRVACRVRPFASVFSRMVMRLRVLGSSAGGRLPPVELQLPQLRRLALRRGQGSGTHAVVGGKHCQRPGLVAGQRLPRGSAASARNHRLAIGAADPRQRHRRSAVDRRPNRSLHRIVGKRSSKVLICGSTLANPTALGIVAAQGQGKAQGGAHH